MLRVCIWMKGRTEYQDYDLWGFENMTTIEEVVSNVFGYGVYISKKSAITT